MIAAGRRWTWIAALAAGFVVGAAWHLPLRVALGWAGAGPAIARADLTGSISRWTARTSAGAELRFELELLTLLTGRYGGRFELVDRDGRFVGRAVRAWDGAIRVEDGALDAEIAPMTLMLGLPPSLLDGHVTVTEVAATWRGGALATLACRGAVHRLRGQGGLELGELGIECSDESAGPMARITDKGGPLAFAAELRFAPDGRYLIAGTIGARPGAPAALVQALPMLGRSTGPDQVSFKYAGSLPAP